MNQVKELCTSSGLFLKCSSYLRKLHIDRDKKKTQSAIE